jgi:hypothetical protein
VIDPATVMQICDAIDDAGRVLGFVALVILAATVAVCTAALFLGLAIQYSVRTIVRRFASGKI